MYIKINQLKINLEKVEGFWNRMKCLMFVIEPLDYGFLLEKRKHFQTYFACQRIDAIITDKDRLKSISFLQIRKDVLVGTKWLLHLSTSRRFRPKSKKRRSVDHPR